MALGIPVACVIVIGFIYLVGYMFQLPLPFLKKHSSSSSSSAKRASANISFSNETIRSLGLTPREIYYMQDFMRRSAWWKTISAEYCPTDWTLIDPENYKCQNRSGNNLGKCGTVAGFKSYTKDYPSGPSGIQLPQDQGKLTFRRSKKGWASKYMCNVDWSNAKDNHPPSSDDLFVAFSKTPEFQTELSRIRVRELSYDEKQYMISIMHASAWWKTISAEYCPTDWTLTDPDTYQCRADGKEHASKKCGSVAVFRGYPLGQVRDVHTKKWWENYCGGVDWTNAQDNHPPSSEELLYDFSKTPEYSTELARYRNYRFKELSQQHTKQFIQFMYRSEWWFRTQQQNNDFYSLLNLFYNTRDGFSHYRTLLQQQDSPSDQKSSGRHSLFSLTGSDIEKANFKKIEEGEQLRNTFTH